MRVQSFLQNVFVLEALKTFDDFAAFENKDRWDCGNTVFNGKLHFVCNIYFAHDGTAFIVSCQFIDDWTQSFARWLCGRIKID